MGSDYSSSYRSYSNCDALDSSSLASTSSSSASAQIVYDKLTSKPLSHRQKKLQAQQAARKVNLALGDLKYEQARFKDSNTGGDIKGLLMSLSTEVSGVELGAYIPYDYMDFEQFTAHRTGAILYAKRDWQLPNSLQLRTLVNFNYIANVNRFNFATDDSVIDTFGGGFGTSLTHDNGGNFIPSLSFALQYNEDDYGKDNKFVVDDHQLLAKTGASLGYRLLENTTVQAGFVYNHDLTDYKSFANKLKDNDYIDLSLGGTFSISDTWQVSLTYKRILGLASYYSNTVFLGTTIGF
jgi:hypothetical protein